MIVIARVPEDKKAGRPALVIRSDALMMTPWVAALPFTSELDVDMPHWVRVEPTPENGLERRSWVMTDFPETVRRSRIARAAFVFKRKNLPVAAQKSPCYRAKISLFGRKISLLILRRKCFT